MIIYLSGRLSNLYVNPEHLLGDETCIMLSYWYQIEDSTQGPRLEAIIKARKQKQDRTRQKAVTK